jgi:lipoate-protein ligase A
MVCNTRIVRTRSSDPWWNLTVEEYLLGQASQNETILYLWQNDSAVVIGRNQNPWKECRTDLLESEGGRLARRLSGGGASYHDMGSLNFSFITGSGAFDPDKQLNVILETLRGLGIAAERGAGGELTAGGRRLSDGVFCSMKDNVCHHGTIHVSTDMDKLSAYLKTASENTSSDGAETVSHRVVNLSDLKPGLDAETVAESFIEAFRKSYNSTAQVENSLRKCSESRAALEELYCKYSSWAWRYGKAAEFDTSVEAMFPWGVLEMAFRLENGIVSDAAIYSDAMEADYIEGLAAILKGCRFTPECLADRIRTSAAPDRVAAAADPGMISEAVINDSMRTAVMTADIEEWLRGKGF